MSHPRTRLVMVDEVPENGSVLFTVRERDGTEEEVVLVRCSDSDSESKSDSGSKSKSDSGSKSKSDSGSKSKSEPSPENDGPITAWRNFCQHETDQRLDRGFGAAVRAGEIVCPKHGSMFDTCTGYCDNGKAADSYLSEVDVSVEGGVVYLTDPAVEFVHDGGIDDEDDGGPSSTSHLTF